MQKRGTSWFWIIVWLFLFWPIGLFLVIKKFTEDKSALMSGKTRLISFIAWILIVVGVLGLVGAVSLGDTRDNKVSLVTVVFLIGGILLERKASRVKKTAARYKIYIDLVINQGIRGIDYISLAVGLPYERVVTDLQNMIDMGYLGEAYILRGTRSIEFPKSGPQAPAPTPAQSQTSVETVAVRCPGCGARNVVEIGKVSECQYCGNPITAKSEG